MESSNLELNRSTSAPVKHEDETITTLTKLKTFSSEKIQCPSSPTQSFSLSDDLNDQNPVVHEASPTEVPRTQEIEQTLSAYKTTSIPVKREHEANTTSAKLKTVSSEKIPCPTQSSSSSNDHDDQTPVIPKESPTEAPRTQEMDRTPSGYRIPSSVFERSQSSSPMEWSTASNESLFSIHMGNMSFTNDQFYMMRSEELNPPAEASTSDQMFNYDSAGDMRSHEMGLAEATMLEVIKENENHNQAKSLAEVRNARRSEGSNTSNKSFAFSIIGAASGSSMRLNSSLKPNHEQTQTQTQPEAQTHAHVEAQRQPEPETPIEAGNQAQSSWFSCFSCCSGSK